MFVGQFTFRVHWLIGGQSFQRGTVMSGESAGCISPSGGVVETADLVRSGELSARSVLEAALDRLGEVNEALNAFVHVDADTAMAVASAIDEAVARGEDPGPLAGVPFGVKDLEDCAGMPTSHGSLLYKGQGPVGSDSIHVARLRAAGAIPLGKTAAPEFGTLQYTRTAAWGVTRNAWDISRTPGGSSGGSAAAVAAGIVPFCTASDGGGSTRIPAAFSGLVGLKPSHGRIPGPSADPSQTAVYGDLTTSVGDAAAILDLVAGPDDRDRTSLPPFAGSFKDGIETTDLSGLRIGWSSNLGFAVVDPEVEDLARGAAEVAASSAGLELVDVDIRLSDPVNTWLSVGGFSLWLSINQREHWPNRADDLTPFVRMSLELTQDRPARTMTSSLERRLRLEEEVAGIFGEIDVLCTPATAVTAFDAEGPSPMSIAGIDLAERFGIAGPAMSVPFTMFANVCWNPAISVPAGLASDGLPVGVQLVAKRHREDVVLRLARLLEQAQPWPLHAPPSGH